MSMKVTGIAIIPLGLSQTQPLTKFAQLSNPNTFYVLTGQQTDSNKWFGGSDGTARALFIREWHHKNRELGEKL